jgi:hypothetical protein
MSFWRTGMLGLAVLAVGQISETAAQTLPVVGYLAAKNADPKRLEVLKQGLAELNYIEGMNIQFEYREAVLDSEYSGGIADLLDRKVDMILGQSCPLGLQLRAGAVGHPAWGCRPAGSAMPDTLPAGPVHASPRDYAQGLPRSPSTSADLRPVQHSP